MGKEMGGRTRSILTHRAYACTGGTQVADVLEWVVCTGREDRRRVDDECTAGVAQVEKGFRPRSVCKWTTSSPHVPR